MLSRSVRIPSFFYVNKGAVDTINEILATETVNSARTMIVSGRSFTKSIGDRVKRSIDGECSRIYLNNNTPGSINEIENAIKNFDPTLVVGVGGGKVLDATKFCAYRLDKPFMAIPTVLSNDGISSPVSVINTDHGTTSIGANPPVGIVVDIDVIKKAPVETVLSGIGDLISNISAVDDWNLANRYVGEKIDKFAEILAKNSAEGFVQHLVAAGNDSMSILTDRILTLLAEGLIQSGIAMSLAGSSRPCSGSEHLISHALDRLLNFEKPHGLQVGLSTIFTIALRKKDASNLVNLYQKIGFPTTPAQLGIPMATFVEAINLAPTTRKERFTILDVVTDSEIKRALDDAYGTG
ncbi:MAG: glycerol-1-phosphate dehydrogenase [NAD(P)+] [Candidatus Nitrosomirales archaeon]